MNHIYECQILLIDDNKELLSMMTHMLSREGFTNLSTAACCQEARAALAKRLPDLIILDVMLPDGNGFSLFQEIRAKADIPILFLSARGEDNDRLLGLGLGADDYLTKPFLPDELILRLSAILKRTYFSSFHTESEEHSLILGTRTVYLKRGIIATPDGELSLTAKELALLKKLNENRGNIVTFDALSDAVWGENYYGYENTLMVHIRRLRAKIEENPSSPVWLLTVRGLGYKLVKG